METPWWKIELGSARTFHRNQIRHKQTISIEDSESTKWMCFFFCAIICHTTDIGYQVWLVPCAVSCYLFSKIHMNGWESIFFQKQTTFDRFSRNVASTTHLHTKLNRSRQPFNALIYTQCIWKNRAQQRCQMNRTKGHDDDNANTDKRS